MRRTGLVVFAVTGCAMTMLAACAGKSPPTNFYVLDPVLSGEVNRTTPAIGVGPIKLAQYLDRLPVVRRGDDGQLSIATFEQWAEPLDSAISRVIAQNLEAELGTSGVVTTPWPPGQAIDYQVLITIDRFEADASGTVYFDCNWSLIAGKDRQELFGRRRNDKAAGGSSISAQVDAMNQLLGRLSKQIAGAIKKQSDSDLT